MKEQLKEILPNLKSCKFVNESYSLDYIKNGPNITKKYKGYYFVYFLINKNKIDYIGITESLYSRLIHHKCTKQIEEVLLLKFDNYYKMLEAEKELIDIFNPPLNIMNDFKINRK
jgi:hypothetical protein